MDSRGDLLLFAVAAQRQLSWQAFSSALDAIFVPDERVAPDVKHIRSAVASLGDSLGHWDVVDDGSGARICISPPVLATLPLPGRPTAVLCGSRSPDTLPAVSVACQRCSVEMRVIGQGHLHPYAPSRVELVADSVEALAAVAHSLHITFGQVAPAWAIAATCGSVSDYLGTLHWSPDAELNWVRKDFDPDRRRFVSSSGDFERNGLSLSAYEHPSGWARQDRLWRGEENALTDRAWGRYAVLADRGIRVLRFDHPTGTVAVPRQVPLPRIAARALGLCTGRPPAIETGEGLGIHIYPGVPVSVFEELAQKLSQHDTSSTEGLDEADLL